MARSRGRRGAGLRAASLEVVLALTVPPQVHFALEALGAQLTAERLEARVLPAVGDEVGALAEGLPAHLALVWLLTCGSRDRVRVARARCPAFALWDLIMFYLAFAFENY